MSIDYRANELLVQKQKEEGLSAKEFADKLGISESLWSLISHNHRRVNWRAMKAIREVYPDVFEFALAAHLDGVGNTPQAVA